MLTPSIDVTKQTPHIGYHHLTDGRVHVDFMDPVSVLSLVNDPGVEPLATDVRARLERVLEAI